MATEILLSVQEPSTLNEFLRQELPKALQGQDAARADCVQGQNAGREKSALSNSKIRRLLFSGNVMVAPSPERKASQAQNGGEKKARQAQNGGGFFVCKNPAFSLKKNARVKVLYDKEKFFCEKPNDDIKFELDESRVLYEDDAIIVVNKPPRFPTEPTFAKDRDSLRAAVIRYLHKKIGLDKNPPYCGVVHRLDRDTSGVILFSKQRAANAALFAAFDSSELVGNSGQERAAQKLYVAVCEPAGSLGLISNSVQSKKAAAFKVGDNFSVQNYLGRVSLKSQAAKWGTVPKEKGGKFARTDFKILEEKGGRLLVQAKLFTGRTHQIRVHLSQKGLPIFGDELYGGPAAERIFLHALSLELPHPLTGEPRHFEAPLPPEFTVRA
ncbi:MAG: RluA family pseudouridine synthase [Treponema sp.]|nr:RluA family pseudouridine synthase [Treponema sp.]